MKKYNVCVVGGTGVVGETIIKVLSERNFPVNKLRVFASEKSTGKSINFEGEKVTVELLCEDAFDSTIDIAFFAAGGEVSGKFVPVANAKGIVVVDNSSTFRMTEGVPLVVPEVNGHVLKKDTLLVANPNCSTIQSVVPLKPLLDKYGLKRVIFNTYQAVSGAGLAGIEDLKNGTVNKFPYNIRKSVLPQIDVFMSNGFTKEEMKMIEETRKILEMPELRVTATTVRVPIENGHSVSINAELDKDFDIEVIKREMSEFPEIVLMDEPDKLIYPIAEKASGTDFVYVGRIRRDESAENAIALFCVADNLRKGAATNSIQIAETLINIWEE